MFAIFTSFAIVGAVNENRRISEEFGSFLETSTVERLRRAEAEAQNKAHEAEEAWKKSRAATDALLAKVRTEMATLNEDLKKTAEKQKEDLAMLEKSREKESAALKETETKLKELQESAKVEAELPSSFLEDPSQADFLAPLRKAAADAKAFAEKIRKEAASRSSAASSFLEGEDDYAGKAERSLAMARQALSKLDADLASQKRELEAQLSKAQKDEESLREGASAFSSPSFLQTGVEYDPLSPQSLAEWREKFNAQLQRAREAAGITTPFKSSLVQLDNSVMDEKLKEDEQKVARLQEAFNSQMAKLKEDNAALLAEAQSQIEKAKNMKVKLEADLRASSFLERSEHKKFNADAEKEKILALQRKWQAEAAQLTAPSQPSEAEKQLTHLIEEQQSKQATAQAELERLKAKLHKDIEALHKDMSMSAFAAKSDQPSFLQTSDQNTLADEDEEDIDASFNEQPSVEDGLDDEENMPVSLLETQDFLQAAKELFEKLAHFSEIAEKPIESANAETVAPIQQVDDVAPAQETSDVFETVDEPQKVDEATEFTSKESETEESEVVESNATQTEEYKAEENRAVEAKAEETVDVKAEGAVESKAEEVVEADTKEAVEAQPEEAVEAKTEELKPSTEEVLVEGNSEFAAETPAASFVQMSTRDAADEALSRAEEGLKKLQEKLRQQSANLASYSVNI